MALVRTLLRTLILLVLSALPLSLPIIWCLPCTAQTPVPATPHAATPSALAQRLQTIGAVSTSKRVLALYYPWYRTLAYSHVWAHQEGVEVANKRMVSHTHYPTQGPYDSADPVLIDRHLEMAEDAGIDTLVCSWWGPRDPTDRALRLLLQRAAKRTLKICVLWEQESGPGASQTPERELTYLLETFSKQPAYLKVNNKPVIFVFDRICRAFSRAAWASTLDTLSARFAPGVMVIGSGQSQTDLLLWDGLYDLSATTLMSGQSPAESARLLREQAEPSLLLSKRLSHLTVLSLAPGYDDRKPNATTGLSMHLLVDRQEGKLYSALWQQAIAIDPDWVLINSFNQWHTGTEIEPSVELGNTYLTLTRQYASQFKKQAAKP